MSDIDPRIFRAYDIRGRYPDQLHADAARAIGRAFGTVLRTTTGKEHPAVILGRDARLSSPELHAAACEGLMSTGCEVLDIGQTPSPLTYFATCSLGTDGSMQITASHNPKDDNGVKLQLANAHSFAGEDLQRVRKMIEDQEFVSGEGSVKEIDVEGSYLACIHNLLPHCGKGLNVVIDAGNGVAGPCYSRALRAAGCKLIELYTEPDGAFPNHAADPSKHATLADLQKAVLETEAEIGLAFDGDGDRVGLVDEHGTIRTADELLLLLAQDHLSRNPGGVVVSTVSSSSVLQSEITRMGGRPVMCKVGHSHVEHAMQQHGSLLGGEQSGHMFPAEGYYAFDDALVAALRVLSILTTRGVSVSELLETFPKTYQAPERRPHCDDGAKADVVAAVTAYFAKDHAVETMDGARIDFGNGAWAGIRYSNTSPCLSICIEARSPQELRNIETLVMEHVATYPQVDLNHLH